MLTGFCDSLPEKFRDAAAQILVLGFNRPLSAPRVSRQKAEGSASSYLERLGLRAFFLADGSSSCCILGKEGIL